MWSEREMLRLYIFIYIYPWLGVHDVHTPVYRCIYVNIQLVIPLMYDVAKVL